MLTALLILLVFVVHEIAHAGEARGLGYPIRAIAGRRPIRVAVRVAFPDDGPPPLDDLRISLAGPATSLLLAAPLLMAGLLDPAVATLIVGLGSLLPLPRHDGLRAVRALRRLWRCSPSSSPFLDGPRTRLRLP